MKPVYKKLIIGAIAVAGTTGMVFAAANGAVMLNNTEGDSMSSETSISNSLSSDSQSVPSESSSEVSSVTSASEISSDASSVPSGSYDPNEIISSFSRNGIIVTQKRGPELQMPEYETKKYPDPQENPEWKMPDIGTETPDEADQVESPAD